MSVRDVPEGVCALLFVLAGVAALVACGAAALDGRLLMAALMGSFALVMAWGGWKAWQTGRL